MIRWRVEAATFRAAAASRGDVVEIRTGRSTVEFSR